MSLCAEGSRYAAAPSPTSAIRVILSGAPAGRLPILRRMAIREEQLDRIEKERCYAGD